MPSKKSGRGSKMRDITRALYLAQVQLAAAQDGMYSVEFAEQLVQILIDLDARTGRREHGKGAALGTKPNATPPEPQG